MRKRCEYLAVNKEQIIIVVPYTISPVPTRVESKLPHEHRHIRQTLQVDSVQTFRYSPIFLPSGMVLMKHDEPVTFMLIRKYLLPNAMPRLPVTLMSLNYELNAFETLFPDLSSERTINTSIIGIHFLAKQWPSCGWSQ